MKTIKKTMKKVIAYLSALCIILTIVPGVVMATDPVGTLTGWSGGGGLNLETKDVNGVTKPVLRWSYGPNGASGVESGEGSQGANAIVYNVGKLAAGTYKISAVVSVPNNPGGAKFGITNDSNGGFPDNTTAGTLHHTDGFTTISRQVTVGASQVDVNQNLWFYTDWGDSAFLWISEIAVQKVNDDQSLGINLVANSDFIATTYSENYWTIDNAYSHSITKTLVNNVWRPVLAVEYKQSSTTTVSAYVGALEAGNYRVSALVRSPYNTGGSQFGISADLGGTLPRWVDTYTTISRDISIPTSNAKQFVSFSMAWGDDHGWLYIADASIQRIYADGRLGENRVVNPDFSVSTIDETQYQQDFSLVTGWGIYGASYDKTNNYTVRQTTDTNGNATRALVAYKSSTATGLIMFGQKVATEANKKYRVSFDAKKVGPALYVGTRMASSSSGNEWSNLQQIGASASDWTNYSFDYTMGTADQSNNNIMFSVEGQLFADQQFVYFDNVSFREVIDTNTLGPNLLTNGDFEALNYKVTDLKFDIVDENGDSLTGNEGYPSIPTIDLGSNKMVATVTVQNGDSTAITPDFVVAIYDGGKLYHVDIVPAEVGGGKTVKCTWELALPNTLGNGTVSAKAFVWKSMDGMSPLSNSSVVTEAAE